MINAQPKIDDGSVTQPEAGLDPAVDVVLTGSRLRAHINGRASAWQDHIVLTSGPRSNTTAAGGAHGRAHVPGYLTRRTGPAIHHD